jgi:mannosyltransferase
LSKCLPQPLEESRLTKAIRSLAAPMVLVLAGVLRFHLLDGQSLWGDEGTSVALSLRDLASITQGAALDIHPPLYYYLLHYWMLLFGSGEIAIRSLSALTGTALVGVIFLTGQRLFGRPTALVAALLSAVSPLQIQYSQEARMYALAALLAALSVYLPGPPIAAPHWDGSPSGQ